MNSLPNIESMPGPGDPTLGRDSSTSHDSTGIRASWIDSGEWSEWDRFVDGHVDGLIYHHSGWKNFLEEAFPHISGKALVLRCQKSGSIRAGIPIYGARSRILGNRMISSPFGTLGGALVSSPEQFQMLATGISDHLAQSKSRRVEIRGVRHFEESFQGSVFSASSGFFHHYLELNRPPEELRKEFSKGVKYSISKSLKSGIEVHEDAGVEAIDQYSILLDRGRRRLCLPTYPSHFVHAMVKHLPDSSVSLLVARKDGDLVGGMLELQFGDWAIYEQVADSPAGRSMGVNHLLLWHSIQRAVAAGRRYYSLGRTSTGNEGLLRFKRMWGTNEEPLWSLSFPPDETGLEQGGNASLLRGAMGWGFGKSPESIAKMMSRLFYQHWG